MVKVIIGSTGTGKTKEMIDKVNTAVQQEKGSVVCIARTGKLTYDISHDARLIDATEYPIKDYDSLLGFLSGVHAGNYDISHIFIDSLYKIGGKDLAAAEKFLDELDGFSKQYQVDFTIALSEDAGNVTEGMKKFL